MTREEEIRKYCSDNGFPLGACSSIASLQSDTAVEAIKWADKTMTDKACEWLEDKLRMYAGYSDTADLVDSFRKAMEE